MKEKTNWGGQEYELEWINSIETASKNITQIYGFLFTSDNKLCIVNPKRSWRLPGGGIEKGEDWKQALIREADEEADIELYEDSIKLIGQIKVTPLSKNCTKKEHYLLRAVGKIKNIKEQTIDIAEGIINERKFIAPEEFLKYCKWGKIGEVQLKKALEFLSRLSNSNSLA